MVCLAVLTLLYQNPAVIRSEQQPTGQRVGDFVKMHDSFIFYPEQITSLPHYRYNFSDRCNLWIPEEFIY